MGELPLYDLTIEMDDETGCEFVSLVDNPAIQINWQSFSNNLKQEFKVLNEDKRIIAGFAMVADMPIYRRDESGEYNVRFTADTITKIVEKFFKNSKTHAANIMHTELMAEDTFIVESFQIDSERGIVTPKGFAEQPNGSWFVSMKVNNNEVWNQVKEGEFNGFSIEGIFEHKRVNNNNMNKQEETFFNKIKNLFAESNGEEVIESTEEVVEVIEPTKEEVSMGEAALSSGTLIKWDGELMAGTMIMVVTEEGDVAAEDGDHELADGSMVIRTEGGIVTEILETEPVDVEEVVEEFAKVVGEKMNSLTTIVNELKESALETEKNFNEFKEQTRKDLETKDARILELSEMEVVAPTQKVTSNKPNWAI